ncbi:uncharacterized protein LOC134206204 [Armigeres subalbatus]|uniref:uncharacterized protein LOC134206204 n=1 Tax=Armigeres subalbatus TaxID=124917 RepID=UPI002ED628F8
MGVRTGPSSQWAGDRQIRYLLTSLFAYQQIVFVLKLVYSLVTHEENVLKIVLEGLMSASFFFAGLKVLSLVLFREQIANIRNFITSNRVNSCDKHYDQLEHNRFNQSVKTLLHVIFILIIVNVVFLSVPNSTTDSLLRMPPFMTMLGPNATHVLYFCFVKLMALGILPRYFSSMACIGTLLMGMRTNLRILGHRYRQMLHQPNQTVEKYFENLNHEVRTALNQQLQYWSHLRTLKDLTGKSFFLVHYFAVCSVGTMLYVAKHLGMNFLAAAFLATCSVLIMEYFLWCHLVDSLQDEANYIGGVLFELCARLRYSRTCHSQHVRMRSSLLITRMNTINGLSMNCLGLYKISTEQFVEFMNTAYFMLMFLFNMSD